MAEAALPRPSSWAQTGVSEQYNRPTFFLPAAFAASQIPTVVTGTGAPVMKKSGWVRKGDSTESPPTTGISFSVT